MSVGKKILIVIIAVVVLVGGGIAGVFIYFNSSAKGLQQQLNDGALDVAVAVQSYTSSANADLSDVLKNGDKYYGKIENKTVDNPKSVIDIINNNLGSEYDGKYYAIVFKDGKIAYTLYSNNEITDETIFNDNIDDQLMSLKSIKFRKKVAGIYVV